jgi:translation initiation factor 2D
MAVDTAKITVRSGMKGKAVNLIHVYQDFLWALGDKSDPPNLEALGSAEDGDSEEEDEMETLADQTHITLVLDQDRQVKKDENTETSQPPQQDEKPHLSTKGRDILRDRSFWYEPYSDHIRFLSDIDQLLKDTFYQALVYKLTKSHSPELLPMSASTLYSTYMLPCRPIVNGSEVDVKKSSWKKMQKFLKDMEKAGVCKLKDRKGETHVVSINWSHEALVMAKRYKTLESKPANASEKLPETSAAAIAGGADSKGPTQIQLYYKPKKYTVPIFESQNKDIKQAYNAQEVRTILMSYVEDENLIDPSEKRMIRIDPVLCDAVLTKSEYNTVDRLQRDHLLQR